MELMMSTLSEMLSDAFDSGYTGTDEQRDEVINDILTRYKINEADDKPPEPAKTKDDDFRLYTLSDLQHMPVGAVLVHSTLGKCSVRKRQGEKFMAFDNPGLAPSAFNVDGYPWDLPMKRVS